MQGLKLGLARTSGKDGFARSALAWAARAPWRQIIHLYLVRMLLYKYYFNNMSDNFTQNRCIQSKTRNYQNITTNYAVGMQVALAVSSERGAMPVMKFTHIALGTAIMLSPLPRAYAQPVADPAAIWSIQDENSAVSRTPVRDHFYTNGFQLGWISPTTAVPSAIADFGHAIWGEGLQRVGFDLSQQMYTPVDTQATSPNPRDRPYAGLLTGDFSLLSDTSDSRRVLILSLGLAGPSAGGEQVQNGFHRLIGRPAVNGWAAQIANTPVGELLHEQTWRLPTGTAAGLETDLLPALTAGIGDLRDYVQAGVTVRLGQGLDSDFGVPRLRPGLSGGDAYTPTRPLAWYVFAGVDGQAVGYDLLLQGGPFRSGPHVSPLWDVAEMQAGAVIMVAGMRLTVAYVAQTPEFQGQCCGIHQFGSVSLSMRF